MTYSQFALILTAFTGVVGLELLFGSLSPHRFSYRDDPFTRYLETKSRFFVGAYGFISVVFAVFYLVGFVGLYFLWSWAPYLFLSGAIAKFVTFCWNPIQREKWIWERIVCRLEAPFEGFLIAILFMGPARGLFG